MALGSGFAKSRREYPRPGICQSEFLTSDQGKGRGTSAGRVRRCRTLAKRGSEITGPGSGFGLKAQIRPPGDHERKEGLERYRSVPSRTLRHQRRFVSDTYWVILDHALG